MSTTSSSSIHHSTNTNTKDRKRSAHWTDLDTETLVNLLLRYKDAGRTADNGFKPEIWEEASILLEGNTYMGGPKTPDACKSRWQRLQRDYKAAKDMEAEPGFTWDRTTNRLSASAECWINAEKKLDSYKYRKIHLPTFDSIAILCANDSTRTRPRASKGRSSLGSISNASSMLSLSTTSTSNNQNSNGNGNGYQQNHMNDPSNTAEAMAQLQVQNDQNVFNWSASTGHTENVNGNGDQDGNGNGEGEFENAFGMPDGSQSFNLGQKRPLPFDPSILSPTINTNHGPGPPQNMHHNLPISSGSPPKKPRPSHSQHKPHPLPGHFANQQITPNHTHTPHMNPQQHHLPPAHTIPQQFYLPHTQPPQSSTTQLNMVSVPHSPEFSSTSTTHTHQNLLEPSIIQTPPSAPSSGIIRQFTPLTSTPCNSSSNIQGLTGVPLNGNGQGPVGMGVGVPIEITNAGLSESQRLTKAILAVQNQQEMFELGDEELIEIFNEFESNVNSGDTYLAIKKDSLRRMWLLKILKRRGGSIGNVNGNKK